MPHFYASYWNYSDCENAGWYWRDLHPSWGAECRYAKGTDGNYKWHLYMWY
ncbi:hypothetical protein [Streptomyces hirsutus]|uniref:hypothetical protein n=1 Tax=Streptomyces hirsutus TaxID=35620 RepID=UPI00147019F5|nr:hypothetical protein [Streptomyces hirsutus]